MLITEEYRRLMDHTELPERFRAGSFALFEEEKAILCDFVDRFYETVHRNGYVDPEDFTEFMAFIDILRAADTDAVQNILTYAFMKSAEIQNILRHRQPLAYEKHLNRKAKIRLRKMTDEEFQRFKEYSINDFAKDLVEARQIAWEKALAYSKAEFEEALTEDADPENQFLMTIEDARIGNEVGWIWFYIETEEDVKQVWLSDFLIYEDERRKGYGTAALAEMERIAKDEGCTVCGLLVWDHNPEGYDLYKKCGYVTVKEIENGSVMKKDL